MGCFNHRAGGNIKQNFLEDIEYGINSASDCWDQCKDQGWSYFGITDSDCADSGAQADCHCGMILPTYQYDAQECLNCTDLSGNEYHCGACGWRLDVYKIPLSKFYQDC